MVEREALISLLEAELGDSYECQRVWSALDVGTMGEGDFSPVNERSADIADAILAALAAQPVGEPVGWRDIASAPKDGTIIVALEVHSNNRFRSHIYEGRYETASLLSCLLSEQENPRFYDLSANRWAKPTHWMPRPADPPFAAALASPPTNDEGRSRG